MSCRFRGRAGSGAWWVQKLQEAGAQAGLVKLGVQKPLLHRGRVMLKLEQPLQNPSREEHSMFDVSLCMVA